MRTQFLYVGLLSMLAGGLVGAAGCSDITAGQSSDPSGPPVLEHVLIQDAAFVGGTSRQRTSVTDLIDKTPDVACSDVQPCLTQYLVGFHVPDFSCSCPTDDNGFCMKGTAGTCNDPMKVPAGGVPIFTRTTDPGDPGGGMQIRLAFNKLLNNNIEMISMDNTAAPGATNTYTLAPGIVDLLDSKGNSVLTMCMPSVPCTLYDNGGTPGIGTNTPSDLLQIPIGPAIVVKPPVQLDPKTMYTIKLNTTMLKDRQGNSPVDLAGNPLPATYMITFTTEDITRRSRTSFPTSFAPDPMTMMPPSIAPNDALTFGFWSSVDPLSVTMVAGMGPPGFDPAAIEFFQSQATTSPADPTKCKAGATSGATGSLRLVYTTGTGAARMPTDWPAGKYTLSFTVQDRHHVSSYDATKLKISFVVSGMDTDPTKDTHAYQNLLTPEQCTGM